MVGEIVSEDFWRNKAPGTTPPLVINPDSGEGNRSRHRLSIEKRHSGLSCVLHEVGVAKPDEFPDGVVGRRQHETSGNVRSVQDEFLAETPEPEKFPFRFRPFVVNDCLPIAQRRVLALLEDSQSSRVQQFSRGKIKRRH
jgi:hypothetical protein